VVRTGVIALAAGLALGSLPAQAATPGEHHHISGNVFAADGEGLPEVSVDLYRDDGTGTFVFYTPVDEDPDPHFSQLVPDGSYKVEISTADPEEFQDEWYDDQHSKAAATVVTLDGGDVVLDDILIEEVPTIRGKVVDEQGRPVEGVEVFPLSLPTFNADWAADTGPDGTFAAQIYPGQWTLAYYDPDDRFATEYRGDANSQESGSVFTVPQSGSLDVGTEMMTPGGTITGTVTAPDGLPLRDYRVTAVVGSGDPDDDEPARDWTDRDGHYELPRLTPGDYQVRFGDGKDTFVTEYYDGAASLATADPVTVVDGETTTGIDVAVTAVPHPAPPGVDVTGRITDSTGRGIPGARVYAFESGTEGDLDSEVTEQVVADATGHYYLSHLDGRAVSAFDIEAASYPGDWDDDDYLFAPQWYAGPTGASASDDAVPVVVVPGAPATADITLPDTGLLHGTTFTTGGTGYPGNADGDVVAHDQHGHWVDTAWIYSDFWQFYGGMAPGTYRLIPYGIGCPGGSLPIDVVVQSLQDTTVPGAAFCRPRATSPPSVAGKPAVGELLTADPGQGSADSVVTGYEWLIDGTVAGTGASYTVPSQAAGHEVAVRVSRRTDFACCSQLTGTVTSDAVTIPAPSQPPPPPPLPPPPPTQGSEPLASSLAVTAQVRRHDLRVVLHIALTAGSAPMSGEVTVREGSRSPWVRTARDGVVVLRLNGVRPGRHTYTVTYAGADGVLPSSATVKVRVRRPQAS
jgi:protocatechuate 3,4-dioxygenase beta subunit